MPDGEELLYRRIGRNELDAIKICRGFVEAEHEYALEKARRVPPVNQYAQRIISPAGRQDGLGMVGNRRLDRRSCRGRSRTSDRARLHGQDRAFHGYFFKVLKRPGARSLRWERWTLSSKAT